MDHISWIKERPVAHRGLHDLNRTRWENTLSAFAAAIEKNYAIECDVHLSGDGVPVVIHDNDLKRLTGVDGYVWQRSAAEIKALRIGGTEDRVPTLAETLRLVDGRVPLVIELKGVPGHDAGIVAKVASELRSYRGKVAIMSFDHWLLRDFPKEAPGVPAGLTAWGDMPHHFEAHFSMLGSGYSFVSYDVTALPNPFVTFVRERLQMPVISWTVRDRAAVQRTFAHADQMTFEGFDPDGGLTS
ncbi:glycerophosphodiester phosphodiesterase [Mesorhizobium sp. BAC0120]|uniref:glycerophosphodiester phosphodiesterase n=1 Tax=Mesorhizobium sp. BAC0120 TaxID=3090670 RepID=UPI00298D4A14|nr:glycerophosphodiester phosphodiesterase [Mesorhizobium sp. BAC0120]MDW6022809.1 glycerophosphodiester phosphodiesterase [Mesorhizobium sp. BAC0120]